MTRINSYGAPTILIDGIGVVGDGLNPGPCSRLYPIPGGQLRVDPAVASIIAALVRVRSQQDP